MERNSGVGKWSMASVDGIGLSRRRHRITSLRDSPEVEVRVDLQEMLRLRDRERVHKKDRYKNRDPELMSQSKRRRLERYAHRNNKDKNVEGGGGASEEDSTAEESFDEDEDDYEEYHGKAPPSTSKINHAFRLTIPLTATVRSSPVSRVADDIFGVAVPRKARSPSVKRSHEYWNSDTGGFGKEHNHRRPSPSPLSRSIKGVSPSFSSVPSRKKMKQLGPKTQIHKLSSKPSVSAQDDIEIEVVEALFDLMKQSHSQSQSQSSKKLESSDNNSTEELDSICNKAVDDKSICFPTLSAQFASRTSDLLQEIRSFPAPLLRVDSGSKKKRDEDDDEFVVVSVSNVSSNEGQAIKMKTENSLLKLEKVSSNNSASVSLEQKAEDNVGKAKDPEKEVARTGEEEKSNAGDSTIPSVSETNSAAELVRASREARLEIDLMAPPSVPLSPDREMDGLTDMVSSHKFVAPDVQMKSKTMSKCESLVAGQVLEEKTKESIYIKQVERHLLLGKLSLEKPIKDNFSSSNCAKSHQRGQEQIQCKVPFSEGQNFAQTNSLPFPIVVTGWPGGFPHPGYLPPLETIIPMDGSARSSAQLQPPPFSLSPPRPKRCITHQHIARSISKHQQLTKNCMWPAATDAADLSNPPNSILGKPLHGNLSGGQALVTSVGFSDKGKSPDETNVDAAKTKQLVLQQASQQTPANRVLRAPAFIFPLGQHQAAIGLTSQSGPAKSAIAIDKTSLSDSGYSFSLSTNGGIPVPIEGAQVPVLPFFNASYYPYHNQQQRTTSQPQAMHRAQRAFQTASTAFSGSSSFQKHANCQQKTGCHTSGHGSLSITSMQQQQSQMQQVAESPSSSRLEKEMRRKDSAIAVDSRESCAQKASDGKSLAVPIQPMNLSLLSHGPPDSAGGNQNGIQQQKGSKCGMEAMSQQQKRSKCGMEAMSPRAFALSFGSTASSIPALNFSSISHKPAVFQILHDVAQGGYQLVHAAQVEQHKNFQVPEWKSVVFAASNDDGPKGNLRKSVAQSLDFPKLGYSKASNFSVKEAAADGRAQIMNVLPSAPTGNQPSGSSTALAAVFSVSDPNCHPQQQQDMIQFQKQHIQRMQMTGAAQVRAPISNNFSYSFTGSNLPNSKNIFSPNLVQNTHFSQSSQWKNTSMATSQVVPSLANSSSPKNLTQQQLRNSCQISFGSSLNSATSSQGQQIVINNQPAASLVDCSPTNSSASKNTRGSGGDKSGPQIAALPSQQTETSLNGPGLKSSPVCGRNVPSIVSTCPSQLSELK